MSWWWCVVLTGGSVSAEEQQGGSGAESASALAVGASASASATAPSSVSGTVTSGAAGIQATAGGGSAAASVVGSGTPSTPVNLPAVLQDRPHSGRGRVPPPVPPRSPRGGGTGQPSSASSSFSLTRGGVAYLTMPPSPRFAGGSPRFSHLCSPSIGMTGYNIWHAESMRRLNQECMMPMLTVQPSERQHYVWQLPTEDVIALSPLQSGVVTPDSTPQKRSRRKNAVREVWDVLKSSSRSGTPTDTPSHHVIHSLDENDGHISTHQRHLNTLRPACLSRQSSIEHNNGEFVLPDTHITSDGNTPMSQTLSKVQMNCQSRNHNPENHYSKTDVQSLKKTLQTLEYQNRPGYPQIHGQLLSATEREILNKPLFSRKSSGTAVSGAIPKSPSQNIKTGYESCASYQDSMSKDFVLGRKRWGNAQDFVPYSDFLHEPRLPQSDFKPQTRKSFAGTETLNLHESDPKRKSMSDRPSVIDEAYIEHTLARYLARSRSPSPYRETQSKLSYGNSQTPSQYGGSQSPSPYSGTPTLLGHPTTVSDAELMAYKSTLSPGLSSFSRNMSSPGLLENTHRTYRKDSEEQLPPSSSFIQRTFYSEV